MSTTTATLPQSFVWKRLHSLFGLWLVLFLCEHLFTNSQAALLMGDDRYGFVRAVNFLHDLPYLHAIEIFLLGVPILVHFIWGVKYLFTSKINSIKTKGSTPSLPEYSRNHAYTWQRITSWILMFLLLFHIVKFRFIEYPESTFVGTKPVFLVSTHMDKGLHAIADKLGFTIYNTQEIAHEVESQGKDSSLTAALLKFHLEEGEVVTVSDSFGTATLITVRDTFKSPFYVAIYTIFVLAACFHGFNGFWTFLITWGVLLKMASQKRMAKVAVALMILVALMGLTAIWGTYWLNLKY